MRRNPVVAILLAVVIACSGFQPARAQVSTGAAVGIGLGAFVLGTMIGHGAQARAYYTCPAGYVQRGRWCYPLENLENTVQYAPAPSYASPAPTYGGRPQGFAAGDCVPSGYCVHGLGAADAWLSGAARGQPQQAQGYPAVGNGTTYTYGQSTHHAGTTRQVGCRITPDDGSTPYDVPKGDPKCP